MSRPNSIQQRMGRLNQSFAAAARPTVWVEVGAYCGIPTGAAATHAFWSLPNTYPMVRLDTREGVTTTTPPVGEPFYRSGDITPASFARLCRFATNLYKSTFASTFDALGKPFRTGWVIAGPDAVRGDSTLFIALDPWDGARNYAQWPRQDLVTSGRSPPVGSDVVVPVASAFFHPRARVHMRSWADGVFPAAKTSLLDTAAPLPLPEIIFTDIESKPSGAASYRMFSASDWARAIDGWFEDATFIAQDTLNPNVDAQNYLLEGGVTFATWLTTHTTTLLGSAVPSFDRSVRHEATTNFEVVQHACGAAESSIMQTLQHTLFDPIHTVFGSSVRCGNWNYFTDSRQHPMETRPNKFRYWRDGRHCGDFQVPVNYGARNSYFLLNDPTPPETTDRETVSNWLARYGLQWISNDPRYPQLDPRDVLNHRITTAMAAASKRANRSAPLIPSVSLSEPLGGGFATAAEPWVLGFMRGTIALGARSFWLFSPGWNNSSSERDAHHNLISKLNRDVKSSHVPRNRPIRFRRSLQSR